MNEQIRNAIKRVGGVKNIYSVYRSFKFGLKKLRFYLKGGTHYSHKYYNSTLLAALAEQNQQSDISDHLSTIFYTSLNVDPKLIVELGTRGGESTRALLAAANITNSLLLSVDFVDCGQINLPFKENWNFVHADDIDFGNSGFVKWCIKSSIKPEIDLLFIDTSHQYDHTKQEINVWSKFLAEKGTMIFHDTNMGQGLYGRNDGSIGIGWNNKKGVMRAIEEFIGRQYDENAFFCDVTDRYNLIHFPNCNGLTILKRR